VPKKKETTKLSEGRKFKKTMKEFGEGALHSGKGGAVVKNPKQAVAISLSVQKKANKKKKK
jgi:hypothetical protein